MIRPAIVDGPNRTILADFGTASKDRHFELKDVKWVIGHRWKQRFIGEVDKLDVVFPAQWSVQEKKWQPYDAKNDWWYPWHKDWKTRSNFKLCAGCHSSGSDHYAQNWTELNIGCESCHGPGKTHSGKPTLQNIVNPSRLSIARSMDICLSCHQAGKPPETTEYAWPVGYQPGDDLSKYWEGFKPEEGKPSAEFWPNGSAHKNRVQGNTFVQSVMFDHGLQCTNCHDSHGSRHQSMTIKATESNALCLTCHGPGRSAGPKYKLLSDHTHHNELGAGSRCIECHMPKTGSNAVPGESRNHRFDFISPQDTITHGVPNSCNSCHTDKTAQWALAELVKWRREKKR
jgi:predicted CXXCH cytochrome family protein